MFLYKKKTGIKIFIYSDIIFDTYFFILHASNYRYKLKCLICNNKINMYTYAPIMLKENVLKHKYSDPLAGAL